MLLVLLNVVVPVFIVIAVGMILGRTLQLELTSLNRAALYGAVPSLVFTTLATTELSTSNLRVLVGGQVLFMLTMALLAYLVSGYLNSAARRGFIATSVFGNSANMMLPVSLFAFGEAGLERALVLFVLSSVTLYTFGPLVLAGSQSWRTLPITDALRLPVIWAALAGIGLNALDATLPAGVMRGLGLLGDAAIPFVLLALGMQMQLAGMAKPTYVNWVGAGFKLVIGPLVGYTVAWTVGARGLDLAVLTLLAAMPPAINTFMLALEFGGDVEEVARTVTLATFSALFTVSVVVWLLG